MIRELNLQVSNAQEYNALCFDERLGLLVDREVIDRDNRRFTKRLKAAKFKEQAMIEDINWSPKRKLDKATFMQLASSQWIAHHQNVVFCGPTGTGKTWLACALGYRACLDGYTVYFRRLSKLFQEISAAKLDGTSLSLMNKLAKYDLLILDDLAHAFNDNERRAFFDLVEDRSKTGSMIITSQLPVDRWHDLIGDPTAADGILDRIIHKSHKVKMDGPTMRPEYEGVDKRPADSKSKSKESAMDMP